jgi:hypothetical protein
VQIMLYRIALGRGFYDAIVDRFLIAPTRAIARALSIFEPDWVKDRASTSSQPAETPGMITQMLTRPAPKS